MKYRLRVITIALAPFAAHAADAGSAQQCARVRNDGTIRAYDPELRAGLLKAYAQLVPHARMPPDQQMLQAETNIRCMDGHLLACLPAQTCRVRR